MSDNLDLGMRRLVAALVLVLLAGAGRAWAQAPAQAGLDRPPETQDQAMERYLAAARAGAADPSGWMGNLALDLRARRVNDLVTVRVEEVITASGTADSSIGKASNAGIGITNLFGLETKTPSAINLGNLATSKSDTTFKGSGATTRASTLTATISARVAEVLPSGDLVVEGVREIEINGDRQIVVLTGIARVADVGPGNVISSTALAQLRIRYFGRGLTKASLTPGWLIRVLNKIF